MIASNPLGPHWLSRHVSMAIAPQLDTDAYSDSIPDSRNHLVAPISALNGEPLINDVLLTIADHADQTTLAMLTRVNKRVGQHAKFLLYTGATLPRIFERAPYNNTLIVSGLIPFPHPFATPCQARLHSIVLGFSEFWRTRREDLPETRSTVPCRLNTDHRYWAALYPSPDVMLSHPLGANLFENVTDLDLSVDQGEFMWRQIFQGDRVTWALKSVAHMPKLTRLRLSGSDVDSPQMYLTPPEGPGSAIHWGLPSTVKSLRLEGDMAGHMNGLLWGHFEEPPTNLEELNIIASRLGGSLTPRTVDQVLCLNQLTTLALEARWCWHADLGRLLKLPLLRKLSIVALTLARPNDNQAPHYEDVKALLSGSHASLRELRIWIEIGDPRVCQPEPVLPYLFKIEDERDRWPCLRSLEVVVVAPSNPPNMFRWRSEL